MFLNEWIQILLERLRLNVIKVNEPECYLTT